MNKVKLLVSLVLLAAPLVSSSLAQGTPNPNAVVVGGAAPLTEGFIREYTDFLSELLGVKFTDARRAEARRFLVGFWQSKNAEEIAGARHLVELRRLLTKVTPERRAQAVRELRAELLAAIREEAEAGDAQAKWALGVLKGSATAATSSSAKTPTSGVLVSGNPALTVELANLALDGVYFVQSKLEGRDVPAPTAQSRAEWQARMTRDWQAATPEQRVQLVAQIREMGGYVARWNAMSAMERAVLKANAGGRLTPQEQVLVQQYAAQTNGQLNNMSSSFFQGSMQSAIDNMRVNQVIIGGGRQWDEQRQRWIDIPGIDTEYR